VSEFHNDQTSSPAGEISRLAEHLFRHEAGKLVSVLTGIFGIDRLQLAEDVVQESLIRALQTWPYYGIPKNPAAWLTQTAKNLALDVVRRERRFLEKQPEITTFIEQWTESSEASSPLLEGEIKEDRLRLMFACCHPDIPQEAQTALALKTLCGFNPAEIAKAFLTTEVAIAKRLTRARQRIRELQIRFEVPTGADASTRVDGVLQTLYLLFNEGYKASHGEHLVRADLCHEAIRLMVLLVEQPVGNQPRTHALLALMLLNAARLSARTDGAGNILRLKEQDRSSWDQTLIRRGMFHLSRSASGEELTAYHLQAAIAASHCAARDFESTDWPGILSMYDQLIVIDDSPVVALNRAVAVAEVNGPRAGIQAIETMPNRQALGSYYLLYAVLAEFAVQLKDFQTAAYHLQRAISLTELKSEQTLLENRLRILKSRQTSSENDSRLARK
jgi:RNA polymerase sigma factor (sigma-70 family)